MAMVAFKGQIISIILGLMLFNAPTLFTPCENVRTYELRNFYFKHLIHK